MTNLNTITSDIIPDFDVLEWKEKIQAEILAETKGMTREEIREYFRKGSEEFLAEGVTYRQTLERIKN